MRSSRSSTKRGRIDHPAARIPADMHVDVGEVVDLQPFVELAETEDRRGIGDLAGGDRDDLLSDVAAHIETAVEVVP